MGKIVEDEIKKTGEVTANGATGLDTNYEFTEKDKKIEFTIEGKKMSFDIVDESIAKAGEEKYKRPMIIVPQITLGSRKLNNVHIAIVESRANKTTNLLLNRDAMSKLGYVVHPNNAHILTKEMEKVKII